MPGLDSVFNTAKSAADAYSSQVGTQGYNIATGGVVAGKTRSDYMTTVNSIVTPTQFVPAGVSSKPVIDIETIGGVTPTTYSTNIMVNARKLMIVNPSSDLNNLGEYSFTRDGTFIIDKDGFVRNQSGYVLYVVKTDSEGNPLVPNMASFDQLSPLNLKHSIGLPQATDDVSLYAGLPGQAAINDQRTQSKIIYDAKGNQYNLTMTYTRVPDLGAPPPAATERWRITGSLQTNTRPPQNVPVNAMWANGVNVLFRNGVPVQYDDGVGPNPNIFDTTLAPHVAVAIPQLSFTPPTASTPVNITINLGTLGQSDGVTTFGGSGFKNNDISANGKGAGDYSGFEWDPAGRGVVSYTNGTKEIICRVPLITFRSMNSLTEGSSGVYKASEAAGAYTISFANEGEIRSSSVETSTASMTDALVKMSAAARLFKANIGVIGKAGDLADLVTKTLLNA